MYVEIFTAALDDRYGIGKITSRIGLQSDAYLFKRDSDLWSIINERHQNKHIDCLLFDEAQFLNKRQVKELARVVDELRIPVLAYGLRTDFQGETFEGSHYLLAWADKLEELKTVCHCGRKANFVIRLDENGKPVKSGAQVQVGGNDTYESVCRKHFAEQVWWSLLSVKAYLNAAPDMNISIWDLIYF